MFELSVACKYLLPRRRQLSVSMISLISVFVIALVVWLIVVFFSVTNGLEKNWINKLTALTAPVRLSPTDAYYRSYYYQIDGLSSKSDYTPKNLSEKNQSPTTDPYDKEIDQEIPTLFPLPDLNSNGSLKDLVKIAYESIQTLPNIPGLRAKEFELAASYLQLSLSRKNSLVPLQNNFGNYSQSTLNYPAYLGNFEGDNYQIGRTLVPIEIEGLNNLLSLMGTDHQQINEEGAQEEMFFNPKILRKRVENFFKMITVQQLKTRSTGWIIPSEKLPNHARWKVFVVLKGNQLIRVIVPPVAKDPSEMKNLELDGLSTSTGTLLIENNKRYLQLPEGTKQELPDHFQLILSPGTAFKAQLDTSSIKNIRSVDELRFFFELPIQGSILSGQISLRGLEIASVEEAWNKNKITPLWVHQTQDSQGHLFYQLPKDSEIGDGVLLPKGFRDAGVLIGDRGSLSYIAPTTSAIEEQQLPVYVAGFYDPGIIPIGGKFILANQELISLIRDSQQQDDHTTVTNGINVRFDNLQDAEKVKKHLQQSFKEKEISQYWTIETYKDYEFTKEMMQELQSQKNLFMLIAVVIIIVACSNIISMLVILVNDKKMEIGILRSMGASSKNISLIFGLAGALIGMMGSAIGIVTAILTLHYLDSLIHLLSRLQGHNMFNANFYGQVIPNELSMEALSFVLIATVCISLLAGVIPAIKACLLRPSQILKSGVG